MIHPKQLYDLLNNNGLNFYCGVPDSTLKDFCAYITDNSPKEKNITRIANNTSLREIENLEGMRSFINPNN